MAGGEAPEKVKRANAARYLEYGKMMKIERRLRRKILKDPGPRPIIPEHILHPVLPERHYRERCGTCNPCKAQDCESRWRSAGGEKETPEVCESEQRRCVTWPKPHPPPPSSWGASSIVSEATAENLLSGAEELMSQQERMRRLLQGSSRWCQK